MVIAHYTFSLNQQRKHTVNAGTFLSFFGPCLFAKLRLGKRPLQVLHACQGVGLQVCRLVQGPSCPQVKSPEGEGWGAVGSGVWPKLPRSARLLVTCGVCLALQMSTGLEKQGCRWIRITKTLQAGPNGLSKVALNLTRRQGLVLAGLRKQTQDQGGC